MNNKIQIWVVGTYDFELHENPLIYNKFITNEQYSGDCINELNRIFSEYVCQYYIWKNQIKSQLIGFCHYRRIIKQIQFRRGIQYFKSWNLKKEDVQDLAENYEYPYFQYYGRQWNCPQFINDDVNDFLLNHQTTIPKDKILKILKVDPEVDFIAQELYFTTWTIFEQLMEFLDSYIKFISNKYNLKTSKDWKNHVFNKIIKYYRAIENPTNFLFDSKENYMNIYNKDGGFSTKCNCWRAYSYIIEHLISIFIYSRNDKIKI